MGEAWGLRELHTLKALAEALNEQATLGEALEAALARLLEMTGLQTAWVFLDEKGDGRLLRATAGRNLPPALEADDRRALRAGWCDCQELYAEGRLERATNILTCSRLHKARADTAGLVYHASALIRCKGKPVGILNVAGPGRETFTEERLELLAAVASLVGAAVERARLLVSAELRAGQFQRLAQLARAMGKVTRRPELAEGLPQWVVDGFGFDAAALWLAGEGGFRLAAASPWLRVKLAGRAREAPPPEATARRLAEAAARPEALVLQDLRRIPVKERGNVWRGSRSLALFPVVAGGSPVGVLQVEGRRTGAFGSSEVDLLSAFVAQAGAVWESLLWQRRRRELARAEERRRVARELHDSVSQRLFSLKLSARAARRLMRSEPDRAQGILAQVEELGGSALAEMRRLVEQLRLEPAAEGLAGELRRWVDSLFVPERQRVEVEEEGPSLGDPSPPVRQAALRIAQEAVGNALRHAGEVPVRVRLRWSPDHLTLTVTDRGLGFDPRARSRQGGLANMRTRAREVGGRLRIVSRPGRGTRVEAQLPLRPRPSPEGGNGRGS
ncbi:GAF domain-containing sensor histidine kinase [Limnochorda pilosa]|uniref:histidine kinase n=1 Tax=Limnochorda pilosa TaxID=1555112 RepID=A0A0K2SPM0_LIMPI|nr:GAF domain-containing protein [Limnochorda pilosa]BAS29046.1 histidine kinase [Limnochorda pilosa]